MESVVHRSAAVEAWKSGIRPFEDRVVAEEPLEIRVNGVPLAVTLRTPGEDDELAAGFVLTEGVATDSDRIERILAVADVQPSSRGNVVDVRLSETAESESRQRSRRGRRPDFITSACGMCGRGTIDAVRRRAAPLRNGQAVAPRVLCGLPERLRAQQVVFAETGGLHAAAPLPRAPVPAPVPCHRALCRHPGPRAVRVPLKHQGCPPTGFQGSHRLPMSSRSSPAPSPWATLATHTAFVPRHP